MELLRALGCLVEAPSAESARLADLLELGEAPSDSDFTETFVLQLYPYASVYLGAEGMLGGEARDRVAGFWRALGQTPPPEPDHLAALLALYAALADGAASASEPRLTERLGHARQVLLFEHLLSWLPIFLERLSEIGAPFYQRWGVLLRQTLDNEAARGLSPDVLPQALRLAPPPLEPSEGVPAREFLRALLAPVRSGLILTRADLARAGHDLNRPLRLGERRFLLEVLIDQAPSELFRWLSQEASRQSQAWQRIAETSAPLRPIANFWRRRAAVTSRQCVGIE